MSGPVESALASVIIPTFNRPATLPAAVGSVLDQTYENLEVIVVNDGGVDVERILQPFQSSGNVVCLKLSERHGLAGARNQGIRVASGKYVSFLDDDDLFLPMHVSTLVSVLETMPFQVAYSDAYWVTQEKIGEKYQEVSRTVPFSESFNRERLWACNFIPVPTLLYETEVLRSVGGFDSSLEILEDWDLLIRLSKKMDFYHVAQATCEVMTRVGDGTHLSSSLARQLRGFKIIYDKHPTQEPAVLQRRIAMLKRLMAEALKSPLPAVDGAV